MKERWDNRHAMIVQDWHVTVDLKLLDGPSAGELITETVVGEVVTTGGESAPHDYWLPGWLEEAPS